MDNRELKAQLRRTALANRDAMGIEARIEASLVIEQHGRKAIGPVGGAIISGSGQFVPKWISGRYYLPFNRRVRSCACPS